MMQTSGNTLQLRSPAALTPLFLLLIILPTATYYLALSTSLGLGASLVAALLIARFMDPLVSRELSHAQTRGKLFATPLVVAATVLALITAHAAVAWTYQPFDGLRAGGSELMLLLAIVAGCGLGDALLEAPDAYVDRGVRICFAFFCMVAVIGVAGISPQTSMTSGKALFPFTEPSHFALIFAPFFLFCCVRSVGAARLAVLLTGVAIAALLQNLTLVIICLLAACICLRGLTLLAAAAIAGLALAGMESVDFGYYTQRLDLSSDTRNLSALVYLQGWQLIIESLQRSGGWGVGFQQLGMHGTEVPAAELIYEITRNEGNLRDGGFGLAKIVSEFGVLGFCLVAWFVRFAWRTARDLRRAALGGGIAPARLLAECAIVGYLVELFVRGTGYFSSTSILLVAALWFVRNESATHRQ